MDKRKFIPLTYKIGEAQDDLPVYLRDRSKKYRGLRAAVLAAEFDKWYPVEVSAEQDIMKKALSSVANAAQNWTYTQDGKSLGVGITVKIDSEEGIVWFKKYIKKEKEKE